MIVYVAHEAIRTGMQKRMILELPYRLQRRTYVLFQREIVCHYGRVAIGSHQKPRWCTSIFNKHTIYSNLALTKHNSLYACESSSSCPITAQSIERCNTWNTDVPAVLKSNFALPCRSEWESGIPSASLNRPVHLASRSCEAHHDVFSSPWITQILE